jgi:hypothetical protein
MATGRTAKELQEKINAISNDRARTAAQAQFNQATRGGSPISAGELTRIQNAAAQFGSGRNVQELQQFVRVPDRPTEVVNQTIVPPEDPQITLERMRQTAATAAAQQSAFDLARGLASQFGLGEGIANRLIDMVSNQGYTPEAVNLAIQETPEFKERFKGLELYKKNFAADIETGRKAMPPTPQQYIGFEQYYQEVLNRYGLGDLATRDTFAQFIGGDVSPMEVQERVEKVYDKVINADDLLKEQLRTYFPNLGTSDFAKALLTGSSPEDMATQLQRKVSRAEISSEMARAGLGVRQPLAEELQTLGVTREEARKGFSKVAGALAPTQKLAQIYEGTAAGIEEELIGEELKGLQSQRRRRLQQQEQAAFSGRAGITATSLQRQAAGTI